MQWSEFRRYILSYKIKFDKSSVVYLWKTLFYFFYNINELSKDWEFFGNGKILKIISRACTGKCWYVFGTGTWVAVKKSVNVMGSNNSMHSLLTSIKLDCSKAADRISRQIHSDIHYVWNTVALHLQQESNANQKWIQWPVSMQSLYMNITLSSTT